MPAPDVLPTSIAALSVKELEILRLLAMGHTAKSIAARLGRSETSINERLRDARRKTGVGSSRELARIVDAQKIWDENIDLSTPGSSTDEAVSPSRHRRPMSKGTMIMLVSLAAAAAAIAVAAVDFPHQEVRTPTVHAAEPAQLPLVGIWSLDVMRIPVGERPRSVTLQFRISGDEQWTTRAEIIGPDGSRQHAQSTAAADGVPVPIAGNMTFADTVSLRQPAPNTLVLTFAKNGVQVSTRVYTVEDDRASMKETIVWADGVNPRTVTTYFNRVG